MILTEFNGESSLWDSLLAFRFFVVDSEGQARTAVGAVVFGPSDFLATTHEAAEDRNGFAAPVLVAWENGGDELGATQVTAVLAQGFHRVLLDNLTGERMFWVNGLHTSGFEDNLFLGTGLLLVRVLLGIVEHI